MKRINILLPALIIAVVVPFLQSCLDTDSTHPSGKNNLIQFSTVRIIDNGGFYFQFDDSSTLYPSGGNQIKSYDAQEGQRVFLEYDLLEEKIEGFTHNGYIHQILDILTKPIITMTKETEDSIGDDRINIVESLIAGGYLNLYFQYYGTRTIENKHMLNLVQNETIEYPESDYIQLEFRHNAYTDAPREIDWGYVCFDLENIKDLIPNKKGLEIRVNTILDGIKYERIDFSKSTRNLWNTSMHINNAVIHPILLND